MTLVSRNLFYRKRKGDGQRLAVRDANAAAFFDFVAQIKANHVVVAGRNFGDKITTVSVGDFDLFPCSAGPVTTTVTPGSGLPFRSLVTTPLI